ncbi:MAG: hypothetical protein HY080_06955 [Gammaproteobacteria bacterium]|nr:hypothetical protein [Gammaproteobacteria bacterium]
MKTILLTGLILFVAACQSTESDYVETDKVHLLFSDRNIMDGNEKLIELPESVQMSIRMDIDHVTWVEMSDISTEDHTCITWRSSWYPPFRASPSTIVSFKLNPAANIKKIDFRMALPCAAFHQKFYYLIKVKSLEGNYFVRKKFPGKVFYNPGSEE